MERGLMNWNEEYIAEPFDGTVRVFQVRESTPQLALFDLEPLDAKGILWRPPTQDVRPSPRPGHIQIQSRRYLGNKFALLDFIESVVTSAIGSVGCKASATSFCDLFAGTGVVGERFNRPNVKVIANDLMFFNYVCLYAWLSPEPFDDGKIDDYLAELNVLEATTDNYVSQHFGGTYFTIENARKIGAVRERIETFPLTFKEKCLLLTSLLYAMDKVANTVGHYDAFRRELDATRPLTLPQPEVEVRCDASAEVNNGNEIYQEDANQLIRRIECDVLYLDPPYNSRQYCDAYHVLENVMRWEKPPVHGLAAKFDRRHLKSAYNLRSAPAAFRDLIEHAHCRHILVSYNNMAEKGNPRSNARVCDEDIIQALTQRGRVAVFETEFRYFTTGKREIEGHTERLFWCARVKADGGFGRICVTQRRCEKKRRTPF